MKGEQLPAEFFSHFISEELFLVPEDSKIASAGSLSSSYQAMEQGPNAPETKNAAAKAEPVKELPFVVKGQNKKAVAVVVNMFEADFASITQNQMLMRLLAAIKLGPDDVAFVNLTSQVNDLQEVLDEINYDNAILFLNPKHSLIAHHKLKQFQPMSILGKYTIAAAELSALASNDQQKRQLWTGLQAMFL